MLSAFLLTLKDIWIMTFWWQRRHRTVVRNVVLCANITISHTQGSKKTWGLCYKTWRVCNYWNNLACLFNFNSVMIVQRANLLKWGHNYRSVKLYSIDPWCHHKTLLMKRVASQSYFFFKNALILVKFLEASQILITVPQQMENLRKTAYKNIELTSNK